MHAKIIKTSLKVTLNSAAAAIILAAPMAQATPTPGYVPPVTMAVAPDYADDTRGIFVPAHEQFRMKTDTELRADSGPLRPEEEPLYAPGSVGDTFEREMNRISNGYVAPEANQGINSPLVVGQNNYVPAVPMQQQIAQAAPQPQVPYGTGYGGNLQHLQNPAMPQAQGYQAPMTDGGVEMAVGQVPNRMIDMNNSLVKLREDRITVRRAVQRMMDQIGGGDWTIVWDLGEHNAALPEMEISIHAEEPFVNVLNALVGRMQTRSGQPLRVIRYDNTQRLVITDRSGGHRLSGQMSPVGVDGDSRPAVTENVLKEALVSLHHDEIPLVDALENIVNQAGKGEWRLRVYAGLDQVLKPAHIEEPFNIAMERLLKLFNLKYEVFPGGKLIVVTHNNRLGYPTAQ